MGFFELIFWYYIIPAVVLLIGSIIITSIRMFYEETFTVGDFIDCYKEIWIEDDDFGKGLFIWSFIPVSNLIILTMTIVTTICYGLYRLFSTKISKKILRYIKRCFNFIIKYIKSCFNFITSPFRLLWSKIRNIRIK